MTEESGSRVGDRTTKAKAYESAEESSKFEFNGKMLRKMKSQGQA